MLYRQPLSALVVLIGLGSLTTLAKAEAPQALPVDGSPFPAEFVAAGPGWQLTFKVGSVTRTMPAGKVVWWGSVTEARRGPLLVLVNGGLLPAEITADREKVLAESALFGRVRLPLDLVAGAIFHLPADRLRRDALVDRVGRAAGRSDQVILVNGDEMVGSIKAIGEKKISIATDLGPVEVPLDRAQAVIYNPTLARRVEPDGLRDLASFTDGSLLTAAALTLDGKTLRLDLPGKLSLWADPARLVFLQPLGGEVTYLSDLKPATYRHIPLLDLTWPYRNDRSCSGAMLRCGGRLYFKGIGMHGASRLSYELAGTYRRFQAELAIDDETAGRGSVEFRVLVDGQPKYTSPVVRGAPPLPVSVDLTGAKRIELVVDYADRGDQLDHADWLDARLVR